MIPATVQHGPAEQTHAARRQVLDAADAATPDQFRPPAAAPTTTSGCWVFRPDSEEVEH